MFIRSNFKIYAIIFSIPLVFAFAPGTGFSPEKPIVKYISNDYTEKGIPEPFYGPPSERSLISKYASLLRTDDVHVKKFIDLYRFIDDWMGTRYKWGGCSKAGIDCSCFVMTLFRNVFNVRINRTTFTQFYDADVALFTNRAEYQMGDLIFFKTNIARETRRNRITHVGLYLTNGYFVQSSSSGVNIANLNSGYWKNCVVAAGRLKEGYYKKSRITMPTGDVQDKKTLELEEDSNFDPVPYPEDMEAIISEYAMLLDVNKEKILVPEVFEFVKRNQYAPYAINTLCGKGLNDNNCFIATLSKDVFDVEFEGTGNAQFLEKNTFKLASNELKAFLDVVQLKKTDIAGKVETITGLYLYNDFFLFHLKNEIVIKSLADSAFLQYQPTINRINQDIINRMFANIMARRKGIHLTPTGKLPADGPQPVKLDQPDTLVVTPAAEPSPFVGPLPDFPATDTVAVKPKPPTKPKKTGKKRKRGR